MKRWRQMGPAGIFVLASVLYVIALTATESKPAWSLAVVVHAVLRVILAGVIVFLWRPVFLHQNRPWMFLIFTLASIAVFAVVDEVLDFAIYPVGSPEYTFEWEGFSWAALNNWSAVLAICALVMFTDGMSERQRLARLENLEKAAQLKALQHQLNPHILLNGLNNIYALATQKNPAAPDAIHSLSEILSYALYETSDRKVLLSREVEVLEKYISLQKIGLEDRVVASFAVHGRLDNRMVAPLIFLPIVENAFKHGTNADRSSAADLHFEITVKGDDIWFNSRNPAQVAMDTSSAKGVGLENVRARLDNAYAGRYALQVDQGASEYRISLRLTGEPQ